MIKINRWLSFIILSALLFAGAGKAESIFSSDPVIGKSNLQKGEGSLAAMNIGVLVSAKSLHLEEIAKIESLPLPSYPAALFNAGAVGKCEVLFDFREDGSVGNVHLGYATNKEFGESAIEAVRQWKLQPLVQHGGKKVIAAKARFIFSIYYD